MRTIFWLCLALLICSGGLFASECRIDKDRVQVLLGQENPVEIQARGKVFDCLISGDLVYLALGPEGIETWRLREGTAAAVSRWKPDGGEVIRLGIGATGLYAVTTRFSLVPLVQVGDSLQEQSLSSLMTLNPAAATGAVAKVLPAAPTTTPPAEKKLQGKVVEVHPEEIIIDIGASAGVVEGQIFEIRSQHQVKAFDLETNTEILKPSNEVTAVVKVIQVSQDRTLLRLGRGDRVRVGDVVQTSSLPLSETNWFPGYQRDLHRIRARLAPFVGIETLTIGTLVNLLYDYSFSFPMRIEAGFRNVGFLFGETFDAPFQFDVLPSYDTELFEVGIGVGYSYSAHTKKQGFTFSQKIRLGAEDGLNFSMWNSFIYQDKHDDGFLDWAPEVGGGMAKAGDPCNSEDYPIYSVEDTGSEFEWNGLDAQLSLPVTRRVTLATNWSYSQAGWLTGEVGIRTLVLGNGGSGTLIVPVSIGGGVVSSFKEDPYTSLVCDTSKEIVTKVNKSDWEHETFGGPFVSIGIDYRWR